MIIFNVILDFIITLISPFKTYFTIYNIDHNKISFIILTGLFLDLIYRKIFLNTLILLLLFSLFKIIKIPSKRYYLKNILLFLVYFNLLFVLSHTPITFYRNIFMEASISYIVYIIVIKKLCK